MRDWYHPAPPPATAQTKPITWAEILERWLMVELDLHELYGIDVHSGILTQRPWHWLETRVIDLLGRGPRLSAWMIHRTATRPGPR